MTRYQQDLQRRIEWNKRQIDTINRVLSLYSISYTDKERAEKRLKTYQKVLKQYQHELQSNTSDISRQGS